VAEDEVVKAISTVMEALAPLDKEAREQALDFVTKRLGISLGVQQQAPIEPHPSLPIPPPPVTPITPAAPDQHGQDIRSFAALKSPKTMNEKVAVMAYFLAQLAPPPKSVEITLPRKTSSPISFRPISSCQRQPAA
jgi:hypothetical protein